MLTSIIYNDYIVGNLWLCSPQATDFYN